MHDIRIIIQSIFVTSQEQRWPKMFVLLSQMLPDLTPNNIITYPYTYYYYFLAPSSPEGETTSYTRSCSNTPKTIHDE